MQLGIDIADVERFKNYSYERLEKMFTSSELNYISLNNGNLETIAGLFCAKEAFFKAIGTGFQISRMHEVEIIHNVKGAPFYKLSSSLIKEHNLSTARITLSISHTQTVAVAVCIVFKLDSILIEENVLR